MNLTIDFSADELAAIEAYVERQQGSEPGLTGELLVARMAKKLATGWVLQQASEQTDRYLSEIGSRIRTLPVGERVNLAEQVKATVETATADRVDAIRDSLVEPVERVG